MAIPILGVPGLNSVTLPGHAVSVFGDAPIFHVVADNRADETQGSKRRNYEICGVHGAKGNMKLGNIGTGRMTLH